MGEAKRRGTTAQRVAEAIDRAEVERVRQEQERAARLQVERAVIAGMPPKEREEMKRTMVRRLQTPATLLGMAMAATLPKGGA